MPGTHPHSGVHGAFLAEPPIEHEVGNQRRPDAIAGVAVQERVARSHNVAQRAPNLFQGTVIERGVAHGDVEIVESRRLHRRRRVERLRLHRIAHVHHDVATRPFQRGKVLDERLPARHQTGEGLTRVQDAGDGVEQLAHREMQLSFPRKM